MKAEENIELSNCRCFPVFFIPIFLFQRGDIPSPVERRFEISERL